MAESKARAHAVVKEAARHAATEAEERARATATRLAGQIKAGEERIATARHAAMDSVRELAAEVAAAASPGWPGPAPTAPRPMPPSRWR